MKKHFILLIFLLISIMSGCSKKYISNYPEPLDYQRGKLFKFEDAIHGGRFDFRSYDLTNFTVNELLNQFNTSSYIIDTKTKYPEGFENQYDLQTIIKIGKNPGLYIKELHKNGITGKGVNIGIIDTRLLVDHKEIEHSIVHYEEISDMDEPAHYHGTPITSLLVGKNVGIAPDANVYYVAYKTGFTDEEYEQSWGDLGKAIKRIVEINRELPKNKKIKVLSISSGWGNTDDERCREIYEGLEMAKNEGIFVISARLYETHNLFFSGLNKKVDSDPDNYRSYDIDFMPEYYRGLYQNGQNILLAPKDARWLASPIGTEDYTMWSIGAWSMVVPYFSGLYTLACQVKPDITPTEFWEIATETGITPIYSGGNIYENMKILDPISIIETIKNQNS